MRMRSVSLLRLTSTDEEVDEKVEARFFLDTSPRLITKPDHVAPIRQAILDLAVRGRLVPQDPADEPAAELLLRLRSRTNGSVAGSPEVTIRAISLAEGVGVGQRSPNLESLEEANRSTDLATIQSCMRMDSIHSFRRGTSPAPAA